MIQHFGGFTLLKTWGEERIIAHVEQPGANYLGKILTMRPSLQGPFQMHMNKDETAHVYSGKVLLLTDLGDGKLIERMLVAGDSVHIPAGTPHAFMAIIESVIFEVSNPVFDDRVNLEEKYADQFNGVIHDRKRLSI